MESNSRVFKIVHKNEFVISIIQEFPSRLNNVPLSKDEEDVSYDAESLFTNIPIKETIDFLSVSNCNRMDI